MNKMYLCCYEKELDEGFKQIDVFVTDNLDTAQKWVDKFNRLRKKWFYYFHSLEDISIDFWDGIPYEVFSGTWETAVEEIEVR